MALSIVSGGDGGFFVLGKLVVESRCSAKIQELWGEPGVEGSPVSCGGPEDVESAGIWSRADVGTAAVCVCLRSLTAPPGAATCFLVTIFSMRAAGRNNYI